MFDVTNKLAVQSWCFRAFKPLPDLIHQIKAIGLKRVELCGVHAEFGDEAKFESVLGTFKDAGVKVASIGVQYFQGVPDEEKWFKFAKQAGATMISTSFSLEAFPDVLPTTAKLAEKYDLNLGIHNHGGYDWLGNEAMLTYVLKNNSPRIGMCIDSAWALQAGQNPVKWAEKFNDRLFGVHIKDFVFGRDGKPEDVVVGTGNLKLAEFMALVNKAPKCQAITLEYEGDENNPGPKLKECVERIAAI